MDVPQPQQRSKLCMAAAVASGLGLACHSLFRAYPLGSAAGHGTALEAMVTGPKLGLGADRDGHGCIPSAGYRWCEGAARCIRPWEHSAAFNKNCGASFVAMQLPAATTVGGDKDAHGCIPSAGYSWCAKTSKCIRPWEHGFSSAADFAKACTMLGGDVDVHGCIASAGYIWCEAESECIRPWEQQLKTEEAIRARCSQSTSKKIVGGDRDSHGCIPSAGYSWCGAISRCIRPWEHALSDPEQFSIRCGPSLSSLRGDVPRIAGHDHDAHGCRPSAGFVWCPGMGTCVRPWEQDLQSAEAFHSVCQKLTCSCPPSPRVWFCSADEQQALANGTACRSFSPGLPVHCPACKRAEMSLACRACSNGLSKESFCGACVRDGLNDVGCMSCV